MRNYRKEYDNYHSRPEQKIRRAARNAARRRFADADPNKDVHHKDNNPLNNDKNNLSLVTQHYNRREPRLRKEDAASRAKEIADLRAKHADEIAKEREDRNKERETADKERERDREDAKKDREAAKKEEVDEGLSDPAQLAKEIEWGVSSKNVDSQALSTKQKKQMKDVAKYTGRLKGSNWASKFTTLYVTSDKLVQQRLKSAAKRGGMSPELMKKLFKEDASELAAKQSKERERLGIVSKSKAKGLKAKHERERELQKKSDEAEREREKANRSAKKEEVESVLVLPTGGDVDSHIISKFQEILRKAGFAKKQKLAKEFGVKLSKRGNKFQVEGIDADAMIDLMQKYLLTKNKKEKKVLLKQINRYQKKLGLAVTEMGTVTGPHIAGTGDDSSTVVVKKKKKKKREEAMKEPWERRSQISKQVRKDFWKSFKKVRKEDKEDKDKKPSLDKRIIDNVLAIQQKV